MRKSINAQIEFWLDLSNSITQQADKSTSQQVEKLVLEKATFQLTGTFEVFHPTLKRRGMKNELALLSAQNNPSTHSRTPYCQLFTL